MPLPPPSEIDAIYAMARGSAGPVVEEVEIGLCSVGPHVRVLALRTPTLPPAAHTSCYLLGPDAGPGALVVVDPGAPEADEQARLAAVLDAEAAAGRPLARVVLTHHHGDHVGGAAVLAARYGVPIAAHAATAARLTGRVVVDELLADDDLIAGWRVVFTPGHAPGHVCLHAPSTGLLVAGDMVAGLGTILVDPSEGDMTAYLASLERLVLLAPSRLLPAHGPMIDDAVPRLRAYVAHRLAREARVLDAVRSLGPAAASALVPVAYADTARVAWPLAERSLCAHLVRLAALGAVVAEAAAAGDLAWRATP